MTSISENQQNLIPFQDAELECDGVSQSTQEEDLGYRKGQLVGSSPSSSDHMNGCSLLGDSDAIDETSDDVEEKDYIGMRDVEKNPLNEAGSRAG